jgi:glycosyltransferase involved in cell wall biosynthesis
LRLAIITHRFVRGDGQGRVNYEIARAALAAGHTVWLVASQVDPELAAHTHARVVQIGVGGWPSELFKNQVFALRSALWLRRHRSELDLVHVNGFITWARSDINTAHFVHAAWARSPHHTARIRRGWYGWYQMLYSRTGALLERWAYARSTNVVAVSRQVRSELLAAGVHERGLRVIPNGVDLDEFQPGAASRSALDLPKGLLLLFVGEIRTPRKNLDTLLRALAQTPDVHLAVIGNPAGSCYPLMAKGLGLAGRVWFLGYRRDIAELMRAVDVFAFPSRYEACSLVLLEAAASGLPILVGRNTGGAELLTADCAVLLENPEDDAAMARALQALIADRARLECMGAAARTVAEAHSWQAMAEKYLRLYAERLAPRRDTSAEGCEW